MAEITRRRTGELLQKLFSILLASSTGLPARDALHQLAAEVTLTAYEAGDYESGGRRFEKVVRFATVDCVKAGWLIKEKGTWSVTDEGRQALEDFSDPEAFYRRAVKLYAEWKASQPNADASDTATNALKPTDEISETLDTSAKAVSVTFDEAEEQAWSEISTYLRAMNPYEFQDLVADLLRAMSYHVSWVSPPGKDGGVDILAWPDPLGTRPPRIKVQVKRQQQAVSVDGLRSFMAVLGDDDVGLFVCTGGFTKDAEFEARTQEKRRITLISLDKLFDLWVEHYEKLTDQARRRLPLRPIRFLSPLS
ncbi:restriction endonuclease [Massilia sp. Root335]|uniref:restriction endonuclease n=1 Tax=Massilia sp. Root335 TaxID=1736517 RepID=UPI0006FE903B|nr:restriction endonuclease [Massilia sp. Root335]KQV50023.1 restriction endonuclease [Massilia sp. Root335]